MGGEESVKGFGGEIARRKEITARPRSRWTDGIRMDLREESNPHLRVWIGFDWLRRGTGGGLL
jgi:hypothetical protein